jgi:hypothetical protein
LSEPGDVAYANGVRLGGVDVSTAIVARSDGALVMVGCMRSDPDSSKKRSMSLGELARQAARELEGALGRPVELSIDEDPNTTEISGRATDIRVLEAFRRIGRTPPQGFGRKGLRMTLRRLSVRKPMHDLKPGSYIGLHLTNSEDGDPMQPPQDGHIRSMPLDAHPDGRILVSAVASAVQSYTVVLPEAKGEPVVEE